MKITTTVEIEPKRIADLMVTAIEGGIGYWCKSVKLIDYSPGAEFAKDPDSVNWYDNINLYKDGNAALKIEVTEDEPDEGDGKKIIGLNEMEQAFVLMQTFGNGESKGYCWKDFLNENEDSITADVWLQLAVFGEVVYG